MAVQTYAAASRRIVDRHDRPIALPAVVTARAERCRDLLRAVVERVGVRVHFGWNKHHAGRIWAHPHSLMISTGADTAAHARTPVLAVVGTDIGEAVATGQLAL